MKKNSDNSNKLVFVNMCLQNSQVELILRAIELYGYNLKYMVNDDKMSDEERSKKETKLQSTYNQIMQFQAEQVNGKAELHDTTTPIAKNMQDNSNIIVLPTEKAI